MGITNRHRTLRIGQMAPDNRRAIACAETASWAIGNMDAAVWAGPYATLVFDEYGELVSDRDRHGLGWFRYTFAHQAAFAGHGQRVVVVDPDPGGVESRSLRSEIVGPMRIQVTGSASRG